MLMNLPMVSVQGNNVGKCSIVPFQVETLHNNSPLRITISDDTPAGSGSELRSSVWLAAITAALQLNQVLDGVKISVDFSGNVDGPSAGGLMCLAIMTAVTQQQFPENFSMTGTIMPDGTIGIVGGVKYKIEGAAQCGIKRMCIPAFCRFERQEDNTYVDLVRLGEKHNIEIELVENIQQAYNFLHHRKDDVESSLNARKICELPRFLEDLLIKDFLKWREHYNTVLEQCVKSENFIALLKFIDPELIDIEEAEREFISGRLINAHTSLLYCTCILESIQREINEFQQGSLKTFQKLFDASLAENGKITDLLTNRIWKDKYCSLLKKYLEDVTPAHNALQEKVLSDAQKPFVPFNSQCGDLTAQYIDRSFITHYAMINFPDPDNIDFSELDVQEIFQLFLSVVVGRVFIDACQKFSLERQSFYSKFALATPKLSVNSQVDSVNHLFASAWRAMHTYIETDTIPWYSNYVEMLPDAFREKLYELDTNYLIYTLNSTLTDSHLNTLTDKATPTNYMFHVLGTSTTLTCTLAQAFAISLKLSPDLEWNFNTDDSKKYKNTDFLHYLIRSARNQALNSIAQCKQANILCPAAISLFEDAEFSRDEDDADKLHDILQAYWNASLLAKVLLLSFKK